jgi:hypothetical protein
MKLFYPIALVALISFFLSCNNYDNSEALKPQTPIADQEIIAANNKIEAPEKEGFFSDSTRQAPGEKKKPQLAQQDIKPDWDKKIIKTATLNAEVKDYRNFSSSLREKIKNLGGYIAQEEQNQSDYKIENSVVIKVPVDQFDNAVAQLSGDIELLNEKKITSQDVTTEIIDTRSRMEAKKQVRLRYLDLLKEAKNMQDILSVQSEINGIQEQIESATGRIEYLGHSSAYSTINLMYYQVLNSSAKDMDKPSFGIKLGNAFSIGWNWIGELFVGLVSIWPLFLLAFIGIVIYKKTRVQKAKQA